MEKKILKRTDLKKEDTWAREDMYESDEAWKKEFEELEKRIPEYENFRGKLSQSPETLLDCLRFHEEMGQRLELLYHYAFQWQDEDTSVPAAQDANQKAEALYIRMDSAASFIDVEILEMGEEKIREWIKEKEELADYERTFEMILRQEKHTLNAQIESILAQAASVTETPSSIFRMLNNADLKFPSIVKGDKELPLTHGNYTVYLENEDREIRRMAYENMYDTYQKFENTIASIFQANVKQAQFYAKVREYPSTRAYYLDRNAIPESVYDNLIASVHANMSKMYRYVSLRKEILGVENLKMYDVYRPLVGDADSQYTIEEAKNVVEQALLPLGEEYHRALNEGFENRWIDVYENQGKRSGAYSCSPYGCHPYVLLNYQGVLDSVATLAHEMGHALHSYFTSKEQPYRYSNYRIFVAEVASTCNEALLHHYMMEHAKDDKERAYLLNSYLDKFKGTLFRQTMFAEFELKAHQAAQRGETLTAECLNQIYHDLNVLYFGPEMDVDHRIDREWARIPHFYTPFYVYQYATGFSAAIALSQRILKEGSQAVEDYMSFLRGGNSKDPIDLLKMAGVDMSTPEPVEAAMEVFEETLEELEKIIRKN